MAAEFTSSSNFYGNLWSETSIGSENFEPAHFTPTKFSFDIDRDSLNPYNVSIVELGTPVPNSGRSGKARRYFLGSEPKTGLWWDTHTGLGIYTYYSPYFRIGSSDHWLEYYAYGCWDADRVRGSNMYVGAYYYRETGSTYIFVAAEVVDGYTIKSLLNAKNTSGYANWGESYVEWLKEWILDMFYGAKVDNVPTIERVSPTSNVFALGQSSTLSYRLVDKLGKVLSEVPDSITVYPGTGWGWSSDSKELRYNNGSWRTTVTIVFTHEDEQYTRNDIFYPENYDAYVNGGTSGPGGGGGSYGHGDISQPTIGGIPSGTVEGSASATGMYTRYLVNSSWLEIFGDWLWTTDLGLAVAKSVISLIYGDPAESVISLMSFPFNLSSIQGLSTRSQNFFWGHHDAGFQATAITSSAITIDWGTISLSEYWGNFLDYTPHTKIEMYLPWGTGFVSIDPGECLPGTLQVITNIDLSKGSCVHNIIGNGGTVIGSYAGQCAKQIPILSSDMASKMAGMVTAAAAGIVTGAAGAVGAGAGAVYGAKMGPGYENIGGSRYVFMTRGERAAIHGAEQAVSNMRQVGRVAGRIATSSLAINRSPTHVSRNGGFTDGSASLGVQYPYIIISRPSQSVPNEYGHHYGYPSNIFSELGSLKGYTEVGEIHLNGIPATDSELTELDEILKGGVIL